MPTYIKNRSNNNAGILGALSGIANSYVNAEGVRARNHQNDQVNKSQIGVNQSEIEKTMAEAGAQQITNFARSKLSNEQQALGNNYNNDTINDQFNRDLKTKASEGFATNRDQARFDGNLGGVKIDDNFSEGAGGLIMNLMSGATDSSNEFAQSVIGINEAQAKNENAQAGQVAGLAQSEIGLNDAKTSNELSQSSKNYADADKTHRETSQLGKKGVTENDTTYQFFDTAFSALEESLGNTETGYFEGRLPAISPEQQIADGAVASMAPALKKLFRESGEGTFTDADQKMLMGMIPTRVDETEARAAKIKNIRNIVDAKLGRNAEQQIQTATHPTTGQKMQSSDGAKTWHAVGGGVSQQIQTATHPTTGQKMQSSDGAKTWHAVGGGF